MSHTCIIGSPGSGKSVLSQLFIDRAVMREQDGRTPQRQERIFSTIPLVGHDVECVTVAATPELARERGQPCIYDVTCGVLFVDELHKYLPARGYDRLPQYAMDFWTTHRHRDLTIVSNTQHVSFVDKICRILTDRVILCQLTALPLVGAFFPKCVRPPDPCRCRPADDCPHARRDAPGDWATPWRRRLRFGAMIRWNEYPPSILNDEESLDMAYLDEQGIKKRDSGIQLFDMRWASRAVHSVSDARDEATLAQYVASDPKRRRERGERVEPPKFKF